MLCRRARGQVVDAAHDQGGLFGTWNARVSAHSVSSASSSAASYNSAEQLPEPVLGTGSVQTAASVAVGSVLRLSGYASVLRLSGYSALVWATLTAF